MTAAGSPPSVPRRPLAARIADLITVGGPITVADYMAICLGDPDDGYYFTRDPFGTAGDFVTAPEISQMFGEIVGAALVEGWQSVGAPSPVHLVELGPGRGTLMADILRVVRLKPELSEALDVHLVETSPALRAAQARTIAPSGRRPRWHDSIESLPEGPLLVIANEFFDALPIRQFVAAGGVWRERVVGLGPAGGLAFGLGAGTLDHSRLPPELHPARDGAILEASTASTAAMTALAARIAAHGGLALVIDYGHVRSAVGDTFQAVKAHQPVDPLAEPGLADLTAHVDFAALARAAAAAGAAVHGPLEQGQFLTAAGLLQRAGHLGAGKGPEVQEAIRTAVERLAGPREMGKLFKVMAVTRPGVPTAALPGFHRETP